MEKYLEITSGYIHNMYKKTIENADYNLRHTYWKEGTKPQNKQLKHTQDATKELEDLYEDYLKPHIKVIRLLKIHCPLTTECINGIQELRKKGIISLVKKYNPTLGKNVVSPKPYLNSSSRDETWTDVRFGVYGKDWVWATIGLATGKCPIDTIYGYPGSIKVLEAKLVNTIGHARLNVQARQDKFDMLVSSLKKTVKPQITETPIANAIGSGVYVGWDEEVPAAPKEKSSKPAVKTSSKLTANIYYGNTDPLDRSLDELIAEDSKASESKAVKASGIWEQLTQDAKKRAEAASNLYFQPSSTDYKIHYPKMPSLKDSDDINLK